MKVGILNSGTSFFFITAVQIHKVRFGFWCPFLKGGWIQWPIKMTQLWSYQNAVATWGKSCLLLIQMWHWSKSKSNAVCLLPCSFHVSWPEVIQIQGLVLLSSCNRGRLLVDARLVYVKQKVFFPKVWLCTMKVGFMEVDFSCSLKL